MNKAWTLLRYSKILLKSNRNILRNLSDWNNSISNPTEFYLDAFRYYYFDLPHALRQHKRYFKKNSRGFGEVAFHSMWYLLYAKYKFSNFLEIGIYRGQILSLVSLMAKLKNQPISLYGISPFDDSGDSVSNYLRLDYQEDVIKNFDKFSLTRPSLIKSYSTDESTRNLISSFLWDCIYIDGSHDEDIVQKDWELCSKQVKVGGIVVFDDASLNINSYDAPFFAFKGHPGPSVVADRIESVNNNFKEVLRVGHNRVFERSE